jgi:hypothetical protein
MSVLRGLHDLADQATCGGSGSPYEAAFQFMCQKVRPQRMENRPRSPNVFALNVSDGVHILMQW